MTLEEAKYKLKLFKERMRQKYAPNGNADWNSPYYYFGTVVMCLLNRNELIEDYEETNDLDYMKVKAKVLFSTHHMTCPSKRRELWEDHSIRSDYKELIGLVKSIRDS